jgi:hypothetical protein
MLQRMRRWRQEFLPTAVPPPSLPKASLSSSKFPPFPDPLTRTNFSTTPIQNLSLAILRGHVHSSSIMVMLLSTMTAPMLSHFRTSIPQQTLATFCYFPRASLLKAITSSNPSSAHFFAPPLPKQRFQCKLLPSYRLLNPSSIGMWPRALHAFQLALLQCLPPPAPLILPPGLALASFILPLQVRRIMATVPPQLLHHAATLLLGGPTWTVMITLPSAIMGGLAWHMGGLSLAMGDTLLDIVPFGIMGVSCSPP